MSSNSSYSLDTSYKKFKDPNYIPDSEEVISNYIPKNHLIPIIKKILKQHKNVIGHTLGPKGTFNLILEPYSTPKLISTKDGRIGVGSLKFSENIANCIRDLIIDIAAHMEKTVGDGTTSGYLILDTLYNELIEKLDKDERFKYLTAAGIENIFNEILIYFEENVFYNTEKYSANLKTFSEEEKINIVKKIASIAANNNPIIAENVSKIFVNKLKSGEETAVDVVVKMEHSEVDDIELNAGFELMFGHCDETFANQVDKQTLKFDNPAFLFIKGPIHDSDKELIRKLIQGITDQVIEGMKYSSLPKFPLLIMADSFSPNIVAMCTAMANGLMYNRQKKGENDKEGIPEPIYFPVALVPMRCMQGLLESDRFHDLAVATGATIIDGINDKIQISDINTKEKFYNVIFPKLGFAQSWISTLYNAKVFGGKGKEDEINERIEFIFNQLNHARDTKSSFSGSVLMDPTTEFISRIAMLKSNASRIRVGGLNSKDKKRRQTIYDDVVRAVQSTISEEGFILGGNVNITWTLSTEEKRKKIASIISNSLIEKKVNIIPMIEKRVEIITNIVESLLESVYNSFKSPYLLALENSFRNKELIEKVYENCMKNENKPMNYNILTGDYRELDLTDIENKCSSLLVPINTDIELMKIVFTTATSLLSSGGSLAYLSLNVSFQDYLNGLKK